jgi:hypothetical protein
VAVVVDGIDETETIVDDVETELMIGVLSDFFLVRLFVGGDTSSLSSLNEDFIARCRADKLALPRRDFLSLSRELKTKKENYKN